MVFLPTTFVKQKIVGENTNNSKIFFEVVLSISQSKPFSTNWLGQNFDYKLPHPKDLTHREQLTLATK